MDSLSHVNQGDDIQAFYSTYRYMYLDDLMNIDNPFLKASEGTVNLIYPPELQ